MSVEIKRASHVCEQAICVQTTTVIFSVFNQYADNHTCRCPAGGQEDLLGEDGNAADASETEGCEGEKKRRRKGRYVQLHLDFGQVPNLVPKLSLWDLAIVKFFVGGV